MFTFYCLMKECVTLLDSSFIASVVHLAVFIYKVFISLFTYQQSWKILDLNMSIFTCASVHLPFYQCSSICKYTWIDTKCIYHVIKKFLPKPHWAFTFDLKNFWCLYSCLCVTLQWSQKLSDSNKIWHKCFCVMQNQLYSFLCTLSK